jgi:hypothetical protein
MQESARTFAASNSFAGGIDDLQNGTELQNVFDTLTGATSPSLDDAKAAIRGEFGVDSKALFAGALRSAAPRRKFNKIPLLGGDGTLVPDFIQASDSILAAKILSDSTLADLDELVVALAVMMLIRRIALDDPALRMNGAVAAALSARVSVPHFLLPISAAAIAADEKRLAAAAAPYAKPAPANAAMCAELKRLKRISQLIYDALTALRNVSAHDFNCPCPPHSAAPKPLMAAASLSARKRVAATAANLEAAARLDAPAGQRNPMDRQSAPKTWSPCAPDKGDWPCPPPLALKAEAIDRLDPAIKETLAKLKLSLDSMPLPQVVRRVESELAALGRAIAKLNTGVALRTGVVGGRVVVTCAPPRNAPKECGCAD